MKNQALKLQVKFHALFILNTYTSVNNNFALQFIIFLKCRLPFLSYSITRVYFRLLLCVMTANKALFELCLTFLHSNAFNFACCSGSFHFKIALNLLKLWLFDNTAHMPRLPKICRD